MAKKKEQLYKQCGMRKYSNKEHTVYQEHTAWIPEQFAKKGNVLKIKDDDGNWDDGWVVTWASSEAGPEPTPWWQLIRGHRDATGDSLPKNPDS